MDLCTNAQSENSKEGTRVWQSPLTVERARFSSLGSFLLAGVPLGLNPSLNNFGFIFVCLFLNGVVSLSDCACLV